MRDRRGDAVVSVAVAYAPVTQITHDLVCDVAFQPAAIVEGGIDQRGDQHDRDDDVDAIHIHYSLPMLYRSGARTMRSPRTCSLSVM
jgi:hypothetical protein